MFINDAPLLFVLFDVEAFEKDGYFPNAFYYGYKGLFVVLGNKRLYFF